MQKLIAEERQSLYNAWLKEMDRFKEEYRLKNVQESVFVQRNERVITLLLDYFQESPPKHHEALDRFVQNITDIEWPLNYLTEGIQAFRRLVLKKILHTRPIDVEEALEEVDTSFDPVINQLVSHSVKKWESTVSVQKSALQELSAPLIPVFDEIGVMPLIGTIDTERAKLIMENLLNGVIEHRCQVVLIDITGVPVVDTMVAHHIIQAAEAVRLVGADCILVGIRPEIAQTIVNLGIELGNFPTKSTLKKGIQTALQMTQREIVDRSGEDQHENSDSQII